MVTWSKDRIDSRVAEFVGAADPSPQKERKRLRILEAATDLFVKFGYRKTSIDEVARRAGVAKGTVYLYFKTKGDLLVQAVAREKLQRSEHLLLQLQAELDPKERLRKVIRLSLAVPDSMPLTASLMSGDREILIALDEVSPDLREKIFATQEQSLVEMLEDAAPQGRWTRDDLQSRAGVLLGLMYSSASIMDERARHGMTTEAYVDVLVDILVNGIV